MRIHVEAGIAVKNLRPGKTAWAPRLRTKPELEKGRHSHSTGQRSSPKRSQRLYSYSHEVAVVIAAYGASTVRLASVDSSHCNVACGIVMVSDHSRRTAILIGLFFINLHCIQSCRRQRLL